MKRDMDLIRKILIGLELCGDDDDDTQVLVDKIKADGYSGRKVSCHVQLLDEAGLIGAENVSDQDDDIDWMPVRLTWEGHEFLDETREESRWEKAKKVVKENTGGLAFGALKMLLKQWGAEAVASVHLPL